MTEVCQKIYTTRKIKQGEEVNTVDSTILYAIPDPCIYNEYITKVVKIIKPLTYDVTELHDNVIIKLSNGDFYIFPKEIYNVFKELVNKKKGNSNILLYGAPGTGKTSFAELLAKVKGWKLRYVGTEILSKYVGETENELRNIFLKAIRSQPIILFFDDAEWIITKRDLTSEDKNHTLYTNLMNLMLKYLNLYNVKNYDIIVILATNVKVDTIDPALISRVKEKVYYTLPDLEAVSAYLKIKGISNISINGIEYKSADDIARYFVNNGMSFRDISLFVRSPETFTIVNKDVARRVVSMRNQDINSLLEMKDSLSEIVTCEMPIKILITTRYPLTVKAIISSILVDVCNYIIFQPTIDSSIKEFLFNIEMYRKSIVLVEQPLLVDNSKLSGLAEIISDYHKNVIMFTQQNSNFDKIAQSYMYTVDDQKIVSSIRKYMSSSLLDERIKRAKNLIRAVLNFYGIDVKEIILRGEASSKQTFEDIAGIEVRIADSYDDTSISKFLYGFENFLKKPSFKNPNKY
ncbi:AAA+ ATPase [Acidianus tailed spindle virus]|uniref:AAA+ ATPase n=1 Tax=Acidianus tailed spindle virus TaxID=1797140 RepID=UPI00076F2A65|nr:AAA+ ATPase [Acidianus tailed spindle virus]AME30079.1 AAA+ ATPase [Acidianus tailed spindle virus]